MIHSSQNYIIATQIGNSNEKRSERIKELIRYVSEETRNVSRLDYI